MMNTSEHDLNQSEGSAPAGLQLPASTAWPVLLALGLALVIAGLVTSASVSILGSILAVSGCVGWFREVLPHEKHEQVPVLGEAEPIVTTRRQVTRISLPEAPHRARLPIEIYPVSAGVKGGLAGSVAMAATAALYGILSHGSIWYPINLLGAIVYAQAVQVSTAQMRAFHIELLLVATAIHLTTSVLVGLLYGAMLPMLPRRPILLGGLIAPLMWTGLLYSILGIVAPLLDQRIEWRWFLASQIAFGIVAGLVVVRQERVRTWQYLPMAARAGVEAPGMMDEKGGRDHPA
ncbi:MAG TPA: hypothetical protein VI455_01465 [Terriglobia bacterium]